MRRPLRRARPAWVIACAAISSLALDSSAAAQTLSLDLGPGGGVTERALQLVALVTVMALAPSILIMVTSFTRIVVVLSLLRAAIGTQTAPPNAVIVSLAMFLTRLRDGADLPRGLSGRRRAARRRPDPAG